MTPVQVVGHRALADLLVEDRDDVGARANGQQVPVADGRDEPVQGPGHDQGVDKEVEARVGDHQHDPGDPLDVGEDTRHVVDQRESFARRRAVQPEVEIGEAGDAQGQEPQASRQTAARGRGRGGVSGTGISGSGIPGGTCLDGCLAHDARVSHSLASVSASGVRVTAGARSTHRFASSEVMTSITAGVMPPVRTSPASPGQRSGQPHRRRADRQIVTEEACGPLQQLALRENGRPDHGADSHAGARLAAVAQDGAAQIVHVERAQPVRPAPQDAGGSAGGGAQQRAPSRRAGAQQQRGADDRGLEAGADHPALRLSLGAEVAVRRTRVRSQGADEHDVAHPRRLRGSDQRVRAVDVTRLVVRCAALEQNARQMHDAAGAGERLDEPFAFVVRHDAGRDARRAGQALQCRLPAHHGHRMQGVLTGDLREQRLADGAVGPGDRYRGATGLLVHRGVQKKTSQVLSGSAWPWIMPPDGPASMRIPFFSP